MINRIKYFDQLIKCDIKNLKIFKKLQLFKEKITQLVF